MPRACSPQVTTSAEELEAVIAKVVNARVAEDQAKLEVERAEQLEAFKQAVAECVATAKPARGGAARSDDDDDSSDDEDLQTNKHSLVLLAVNQG